MINNRGWYNVAFRLVFSIHLRYTSALELTGERIDNYFGVMSSVRLTFPILHDCLSWHANQQGGRIETDT